MTEGAYRRYKHAVHGILPQLACDLRTALRNQPSRGDQRSHDAKVPGRRFADNARIHQLPQAVERESQVPVGLNAGVIERLAALSDLERCHRRPPRDLAVRTIVVSVGFVERFLVREIETGGCKERDAGVLQRLPQCGAWPPVHAPEWMALDQEPVLPLQVR